MLGTLIGDVGYYGKSEDAVVDSFRKYLLGRLRAHVLMDLAILAGPSSSTTARPASGQLYGCMQDFWIRVGCPGSFLL